jgi:hypothetical protein
MPKQGDIREDGFIFKSKYTDKKGIIRDQWLSPKAWENWKSKRNECTRLNYHANIEKEHERSRQYRLTNQHISNARAAKRRAAKRSAKVFWLSKEHIQEIKLMYLIAKIKSSLGNIKYEVDHIEPLQGKDVCGLHVPWNLQIIPMRDNRSKGIKRGL